MAFVSERTDYEKRTLTESDVGEVPMPEVARWVADARAANVAEPLAMTLATVGEGGAPSARIVLARRVDEAGVVFFTNYESRKGQEITHDPRGSAVFFWPTLERQIRLEGTLEALPAEDSDAYYRERPAQSRVGAWASPQSRPLRDRRELEALFEEAERAHGSNPERPPFWGGYLLAPTVVELWQGRRSRLHDRLRWRYLDKVWIRERLAP